MSKPGLIYKSKEERPLCRETFSTHKILKRDFNIALKKLQEERKSNLDPVPTRTEIYRHLQALFISFGEDLLDVRMEKDLKRLTIKE
jgi:hypothetical protein